MCGGVTIAGGAFRLANAFCVPSVTRSVAIDKTARHFDRIDDRFLIERAGGAQIDDIAADALARQLVGNRFAQANHQAHGDDRDILPRARQAGVAEWDGIILVRHFAGRAVERLVLEKDHGIIIADRLGK